MGTLRGDNGGGERPQDGGGLPDLPPEWGTIIIPDDASALDDEGAAIRRVFRRAAFRRRWRRRLHLKPRPMARADDESPGLAVPLMIMTVAVIATLASLFAVAWPGQRPRVPTQTTRNDAAPAVSDISLYDANGNRVPLREAGPAVVMLVEGCSCETFISVTAKALADARPTTAATPGTLGRSAPTTVHTPSVHVSILVVDTGIPSVPRLSSDLVALRGLADPSRSLRAAIPLLEPVNAGGDLAAAVLLIDRDGKVLKVVPNVRAVDDFRDDLVRLW
jgi:hypothetical protein